MFQHIVLYKLKDGSIQAKKALKEKFMSMQGNVEQIKQIEVGIDVLQGDRSFDVSLFIRFANMQDFLDYKSHPYHLQVAEFVQKVKDKSVSVDYEDND